MPRPKGKPNKRSELLLRKLENDHKFYVAKELIQIYGQNKEILMNLATKMQENIAADKSPLAGFSQDEITLYNSSNKDCLNMLLRMLAYLYPKLKSMEVGTGAGDKVVFNINTLPSFSPPKPDSRDDLSQVVH